MFDELMEHALAEYDRIVGVDVSHVMIDGSSQLAPGGGPDTALSQVARVARASKWSIGVDAAGVGLGFVLDTGGRNDYRLLQPTLDTIVDQPAVTNIGTLHLDRGYGYPSLADRVADYPIDNIAVIPRNQPGQGRIELVGFGWNWIVERTNAWLTNFRQLKINWDRTIKHRHAAVCLAFTIICLYRIINHLTATNQPLTSIR